MTWSSHGGDYEDGCLLGCSGVLTGLCLTTFDGSGPAPTSGRSIINNRPDDGGSTDLWTGGKLLPVYTALQPRRQPSSRNTQFVRKKMIFRMQTCVKFNLTAIALLLMILQFHRQYRTNFNAGVFIYLYRYVYVGCVRLTHGGCL
jgi:hypothetical protein